MGAYFDCGYPRFCPGCGKRLTVDRDHMTRDDWEQFLAHKCGGCGIQFIKLSRFDLPEQTKEELDKYEL